VIKGRTWRGEARSEKKQRAAIYLRGQCKRRAEHRAVEVGRGEAAGLKTPEIGGHDHRGRSIEKGRGAHQYRI